MFDEHSIIADHSFCRDPWEEEGKGGFRGAGTCELSFGFKASVVYNSSKSMFSSESIDIRQRYCYSIEEEQDRGAGINFKLTRNLAKEQRRLQRWADHNIK